eukprot:8643622-Pyramimonas_sp.AAC.1
MQGCAVDQIQAHRHESSRLCTQGWRDPRQSSRQAGNCTQDDRCNSYLEMVQKNDKVVMSRRA